MGRRVQINWEETAEELRQNIVRKSICNVENG